MNSQYQPDRRTLRYPLHLPVAIRFGDRVIQARSENISMSGILLSSEASIPEGADVELMVGVARLPEHGMLMTAKGKVLRLRSKDSGNFALAIQCDGAFELMRREKLANIGFAGER